MAEIDVIAQGFGTSTSEGMISYCGITLIRGERLTLVDVGYQARRVVLVDRLAERGIRPEDIGRIVLTHAHWDHSLNLLRFPNAEVVEGTLRADQKMVVERDGVTVTFTRDARGHFQTCVEGPLSIARLSAGAGVTRQAVTKHLHTLGDAGLVRHSRRGNGQYAGVQFENVPAPDRRRIFSHIMAEQRRQMQSTRQRQSGAY